MPIDTDYFVSKKIIKENKVIKILSVGRLVKWKGHQYGVRAVNELVNKDLKLEYHIIGEGEELYSLASLANELGIQKYVFFTGLRHKEKYFHLCNALTSF